MKRFRYILAAVICAPLGVVVILGSVWFALLGNILDGLSDIISGEDGE